MTDKPAETMLERMARAMYERPLVDDPTERSFDDLMAFEKELLIGDAKAALEAIRMPSDEVVQKAVESVYADPAGRENKYRHHFSAVVSAILNEEA